MVPILKSAPARIVKEIEEMPLYMDRHDGENRGGLVCLNSAARFDKWNRAAVR